MIIAQRKASVEKRSEPRETYTGSIFFASKEGFHEGRLKNYSQNGLFIAIRNPLPVGELLTVALPYLDNKSEKRKGQIMWRCKEGFGVELFRERNVGY
jgi:hypothetical protein